MNFVVENRRVALFPSTGKEAELVSGFESHGWSCVTVHLLEAEPITDGDLYAEISPNTILIFTSTHAVDSVASQLDLRQRRCAVVGEATAQRVRAAGGIVSVIPSAATGEALARELSEKLAQDSDGAPLLFFRGERSSGSVAEGLAPFGPQFRESICYRIVPVELGDVARKHFRSIFEEDTSIVVLTSAQGVEAYSRAIDAYCDPIHRLHARTIPIAAFSSRVAQRATEVGFTVKVIGSGTSFKLFAEECVATFTAATVNK